MTAAGWEVGLPGWHELTCPVLPAAHHKFDDIVTGSMHGKAPIAKQSWQMIIQGPRPSSTAQLPIHKATLDS